MPDVGDPFYRRSEGEPEREARRVPKAWLLGCRNIRQAKAPGVMEWRLAPRGKIKADAAYSADRSLLPSVKISGHFFCFPGLAP